MSLRRVAIIVLATIVAACGHVSPASRGKLQEPAMQPPLDPLEVAMDVHVYENREAQVGARYGRGASCGCN